MHKERLLLLADHLENVKPNEFNMSHWWEEKTISNRNLCKTTGCAMGHACSIPEFQKLGLRLDHGYLSVSDKNVFYRTPVLDDKRMYEAAQELFEISYADVEYLFCPDTYTEADICDPIAVAKRIREFANK